MGSPQTAAQIAAAVGRGEVTAVEVTTAALERAERDGPRVGAFVVVTPELAVAQAREVDRRVAAGEALPLAGVPCPIKDLNPVAGVGWEAGSAALAGNVADVDDGLVTWLRDAGTTMIGKTTTPEFGFPCYTEPATGEPARTPWDLSRSAGGSSGGAAAAVAAGIVPIAQASDGGGSIRIPASACGIVGLKPSRGLVSSGPLREPGAGLATDGVLTRTVLDTALALDVLAGPRPGDSFSCPMPATGFVEACSRPASGLRVGVLLDPVIVTDAPVDPRCRQAVLATADLFAELGHQVAEAPRPFPAERWAAFEALWSVGALGLPIPEAAIGRLRPLTRWLREVGAGVTGVGYAAAVAAVQRLTREVADNWADFDVVVTPTLAQPPAPIGALRNDEDPAADFRAQMEFTPWTSVANLTGRPSISLPCWTATVDQVELPFGVMLTGRFGHDAVLLSLAATVEQFGFNRLLPHGI